MLQSKGHVRLPLIVRPRGLGRTLLVLVLIFALLFIAPASVFASWISWLGVGCSIAAIGAYFIPGKGTAIAIGLVVTQIVLVALDTYLTMRGIVGSQDPSFPPDFAAAPEPDALDELYYLQFEHLPLRGDDTDAFIGATNRLIDAFNQFMDDVLNQEDDAKINADLLAISQALADQAGAYDIIDWQGIELTQQNINAVQADWRTNGLAEIETQALYDAGAPEDYVQAFGGFVANAPMNLRAPSVNPSELLHTAAAEIRFAVTGG